MPTKKSRKTIKQKLEPPPIRIKVSEGKKTKKEVEFRKDFFVGRGTTCELRIEDDAISRRHVRVFFEDGGWWIVDHNSTNGLYLEEQKVHELKIEDGLEVSLGKNGPKLTFTIVLQDKRKKKVRGRYTFGSVTQYIDHYFGESDKKMGHHTKMIQSAYLKLKREQKQKFSLIITAIVIICMFIAYVAYSQYKEVQKQKAVAVNLFYSMKSLELKLTTLEENASEETKNEIAVLKAQQRELLRNYDESLRELHIYDEEDISEEDRIILRVARIFGECEVGAPKNFIKEVKKYIKKWKTTDRLNEAIQRALENNYHAITADVLLKYDLPPQFFYLALQESDFKNDRVGPKTRFGIAKGIWQFIPSTARHYGLRTGPLVQLRRYDPRDERYNFGKATEAAAKYIHDLYKTEAQASGLLVFASYNWGQTNIRRLIRSMPNDPRERNFWQLLKKYRNKIPQETYDYVFYIISAAVIGENPELFGFDFSNPFSELS
jgi:pSer/pThr/pTyr-binding forkhead associated (FHA) protein